MEKIFAAGPSITELEIKTVEDAMRNGWYENAYDYCEKFQKEFAAYHDRKYALMTPNCTSAIHLLLAGLGIGPDDEVIIPDCTWIATGAGVTYLGATPVFCDIDAVNWCLCPNALRKSITEKTKAIIVVDLWGNMPHMDEILEIGREFGIPVIEDAAEALGAEYKGTKAGKFGVGSVFSFHRTKTITTGEGGMLLDDDALFERCSFLRDHGRKSDGLAYYNYEVTFKYMPFNLQAALGYAQFQRLDELIALKRQTLHAYKSNLSGIEGLQFNEESKDVVNGAWITTLVFDKSYNLDKIEAIAFLEARGIPARPFFYPLSSLPAYPGCREKYESLNHVSYDISQRGISLPGAGNITEEQIIYICDAVKEMLGQKKQQTI